MRFTEYRLNLGRNDFLTILRLPMSEHGMSLSAFGSSRILFDDILQFEYRCPAHVLLDLDFFL